MMMIIMGDGDPEIGNGSAVEHRWVVKDSSSVFDEDDDGHT